jgi:hypothetical protein
LLKGSGDNSSSDWLRKYQRISRERPGIRVDASRIDETGDSVSEFHLGVANRVTPDHCTFCFCHLRETAAHDLLKNREVCFLRETYNCKRSERAASHRIDIAQGIGRSDLTECERVIDQRSEEVDGLHQSLSGSDAVNPGIVRSLKPNQEIRVGLRRKGGQYLPEGACRKFACAAAGLYLLRQANSLGMVQDHLLIFSNVAGAACTMGK